MDYLQLMLQGSKKLPEDTTWEAVAHSLDELLAKQSNLSEEQIATLVGVGALIVRQGLREFEAGNRTEALFKKLSR